MCTNETEDDYEFVFKSFKIGLRTLYEEDLKPEILICDAAHAIHNGFRKVFGEDKPVVMCWAHMRRALVKKLPSFLKNKKQQLEFTSYIDKVQVAKSSNFDTAIDLLLKKWSVISKEMTDYFVNEWLVKNRFWYEAVVHFTPSTNNALESCNKLIKDENTLRDRLDLRQFRFIVFGMIQSWSIAYDSSLNAINNDGPNITLRIGSNAYEWSTSQVKFSKKNGKATSCVSIARDC